MYKIGEKAMPRKYRMVEMRMLSEWLAQYAVDYQIKIREWLGPIPEGTALKRAGVTPKVLMPFGGGWADALILAPDWTRIVEACVIADTRHVGALEGYVKLFFETTRYANRWDKPVIPVLLYAYPRKVALDMAKEKGFECVEYRPDWIKAYLEEITR